MKMNWPIFLAGAGFSAWISSWVALLTSPFVVFCMAYPIMLYACWLMSEERFKLNERKKEK